MCMYVHVSIYVYVYSFVCFKCSCFRYIRILVADLICHYQVYFRNLCTYAFTFTYKHMQHMYIYFHVYMYHHAV